jgi:hypothetical protein
MAPTYAGAPRRSLQCRRFVPEKHNVINFTLGARMP